jgi:hypothetical protein
LIADPAFDAAARARPVPVPVFAAEVVFFGAFAFAAFFDAAFARFAIKSSLCGSRLILPGCRNDRVVYEPYPTTTRSTTAIAIPD